MLRLLSDMLHSVGFVNVHTAKDGSSALRRLHTQHVDIVICDWKMEPMNGVELLEHIRTSPDSPNRFLPIIMLTGRGERHDVEEARDGGVTEYLIKPFSAAGLFDRIKRTIDNPRKFVLASVYSGPDRRRMRRSPPDGNEKRHPRHPR